MSDTTCSVPVCDRPVSRQGWCDGHYSRQLRGQRMDTPIRTFTKKPAVCTVDGCENTKYIKRGLCASHYYRAKHDGDIDGDPCSVDGCDKFSVSRRLCQTHYSRWLRTGQTTTTRMTLEQAFLAKTEQRGDCLIWTGASSDKGYGRLSAEGQKWGAHIYSWTRTNGPVPDGLEVNHICHNRACCAIEHLELLTHQANSAYRKGAQSNNVSAELRGVSYHKGTRKWQATVHFNYDRIYLGIYSTREEAAEVARAKREELYGRPDFNGRDTTA